MCILVVRGSQTNLSIAGVLCDQATESYVGRSRLAKCADRLSSLRIRANNWLNLQVQQTMNMFLRFVSVFV